MEDIEKQAKGEASLKDAGKRLQELEQEVKGLESRLEARVESFIEDLRSEF